MIEVGVDGYVEVPRPQCLTRERKALNRLVDGGLARRVDVAVKQRGGGRRGSRELTYFLSDARKGEAAVTAGKLCGVSSSAKAKNDYGRGGLKGLHGKVRNDVLIRLLYDAAAARAGGEDVEVPLEEAWAESCPDYPILGAKVTHDDAGRALDEWELRKAGYEEIVPDGRFLVEWPGQGLACAFDLELEMGTRTQILAQKLDARAAAWLRFYEVAEARERASWDAEYDALWDSLRDLGDHPDEQEAARKPQERLGRLRERYRTGPLPYFAGLPREVVPVVVVMETERKADGMRARLFEEAEMPRYVELVDRLGGFDEGDDREEDGKAPMSVGRLFLFASLETLLPFGVEGPGETLDYSYLPLELGDDGEPTVESLSLGEVAHWLAGLREPRRRF